nr:hypothetical protein [bacterium]
MLYPKSQEKELSAELFQNPTAEYRGAPFWAWNNVLDAGQLTRQIEMMHEMGLGGFHMHSRSGMGTPYLSDEFMDCIRACNEKARELGMLSWLYDEDRWPSGSAGGIVTKDTALRQRHLEFTPVKEEGQPPLACYAVRLKDGCLEGYRQMGPQQAAVEGEEIWYAYLRVAGDNPWYNNQAYLDTLNPRAVKEFVRITHERYKQVLGQEFGKSVPAIFTDEPNRGEGTVLGFADEKRPVIIPYTDDFPVTYQHTYGADFFDTLPELVWELPQGYSQARYRYYDHIAERFAAGFADVVGAWCKNNNLLLTGHVLDEPTLQSQTGATGEAMRSYRSFGLPGIDMLCDWREYATAKQAQSASHQYGCPGVLSELYGVTNWDFDFRGHKLQGDWQAALGVTCRVQHLTWVSMAGEAKRDYPASIGYQSPWYKEYPYVENHFARVNTALTRGKADVRVGVIHPIESYWLLNGPQEQTRLPRQNLETLFANITQWLLFGLVDFDFIAESLLLGLCDKGGAPLTVGQMAYDAIVVPGMITMRASTLERLEAFRQAGGKLIFVGRVPELVDAVPSDRVQKLAKGCLCVPQDEGALLHALEGERMLDIRVDGVRTEHLLHQLRRDGQGKWLFIANGKKPLLRDEPSPSALRISVKGEWQVTLYDTLTGDIRPVACEYAAGQTRWRQTICQHDSLLYRLMPGRSAQAERVGQVEPCFLPLQSLYDRTSAVLAGDAYRELAPLRGLFDITLSEPNVLVLDMAASRLDGGEWQPVEEVLRIDNAARAKLGWPQRRSAWAQPWVVPPEKPSHTLELAFTIQSNVPISAPRLAIEDAADVAITLNGRPVENRVEVWYTDEAIQTVALPDLPAGSSTLQVAIPFGRRRNVEACYLLGDFSVRLFGTQAVLDAPISRIGFGDYATQGLPFYGGNVTYRIPFVSPGGKLIMQAAQYRSPVMRVGLDGRDMGLIAYAPYALQLGLVDAGEHVLEITCYGSRINTFGQLHNTDDNLTWYGPDSWRTQGERWGYEYRLHACGVLAAPRLMVEQV